MSPRISVSLLSAQSDQRLAALAGEGHERAFEALVHRYRRPLLRYCRRMRLADARAEDVLQQSFLQAWMAFARGVEVREVRPWLYRIVHNAAVNAMRGAADGHGELTEAMQAKAALAGESELQRKMAVHDALADMAALPQMQQQAIFLTAVDGQTHDEVASVLGISEGALRGLLYRARASLRRAAAALTPPPLLEWAARGADTAGPAAERVAELSGGGGAAGMAGLLLKGAVVAVTAGALATGATVVNSPGRGDRPAVHRTSTAGLAGATADRQTTGGDTTPALAPGPGGSGGLLAGAHLHTRRRRHDDGSGVGARGRHDDRFSSNVDRPAGSQSGGGGAIDDGGQLHDRSGSVVDGSGGEGGGPSEGSRGADSSGGTDGGRPSTASGEDAGGKDSGNGSSGSSHGGSDHSGAGAAESVPVKPTSSKDIVASAPSQTPTTGGGGRSGRDDEATERSGRGSGSDG